jgi:hypothetical protein
MHNKDYELVNGRLDQASSYFDSNKCILAQKTAEYERPLTPMKTILAIRILMVITPDERDIFLCSEATKLRNHSKHFLSLITPELQKMAAFFEIFVVKGRSSG